MKYPLIIGLILISLGVIFWKPVKKLFDEGNNVDISNQYKKLNNDNVLDEEQEISRLDDDFKFRVIDQIIGEAIQLGDIEKKYSQALELLDEASSKTNPMPNISQKQKLESLRSRYMRLVSEESEYEKSDKEKIDQKPYLADSQVALGNKNNLNNKKPKNLLNKKKSVKKIKLVKKRKNINLNYKKNKIKKKAVYRSKKSSSNKILKDRKLISVNKNKKQSNNNKNKKNDNIKTLESKSLGNAESVFSVINKKFPTPSIDNNLLEKDKTKDIQDSKLVSKPIEIEEFIKKDNLDILDKDNNIKNKLALNKDLNSQVNELYYKGKEQLDQGKYDKSLSYFNKALSLDDNHIPSNSYKSTSLLKKNDYSNALQFADKTLQLDNTNANAYLTKGEIFYKKLDNVNAEKEFNTFISIYKGNAYVYFKLGVLNLLSENNQNAIELFEKALNITTISLNNNYRYKTYYNLGISYDRLNNLNMAEINYKKALEINKESKKTTLRLSLVDYKRKAYQSGIDKLQNISLQNVDGEVYSNSSSFFLMAKSYNKLFLDNVANKNISDNALAYYKKLLDTDQSNYIALFNMALIQLQSKNFSIALDYFIQANQIQQNDYLILCGLGKSYFHLNDYKNSVYFYQKAYNINNNRLEGMYGLSISMYFYYSKNKKWKISNNEYKQLIRYFNNLNDMKVNDSTINHILAIIYFNFGEIETSISFLSKSLNLDEFNLKAKYNLANIYFINKNFYKSLINYEKLLGSDFSSKDDLYLRIAECYYKLNNIPNSKKYLNTILRDFPNSKNIRKVELYLSFLNNRNLS